MVSEDRAMSPDLIDRAALLRDYSSMPAAMFDTKYPEWYDDPRIRLALTGEAAPRAATEPLHEGRWFVHRDPDAATEPPLPSELDIAVALQGVDPADLRLGHDLRKPAAVILANLKRAVAHKALTSSIPVIYLAHPLGGDWEGNIASARVYAERAVRILGVCPVAPYLTLYGLLHEPADRLIGIGLDAAIIPKCDELWLCGPRVSPGMELERDQALKLGIPVRRWTAPDAELRDL